MDIEASPAVPNFAARLTGIGVAAADHVTYTIAPLPNGIDGFRFLQENKLPVLRLQFYLADEARVPVSDYDGRFALVFYTADNLANTFSADAELRTNNF